MHRNLFSDVVCRIFSAFFAENTRGAKELIKYFQMHLTCFSQLLDICHIGKRKSNVLLFSVFSLQWFRSAVVRENAMPEGLMNLLFSNIDPIYEFHRRFLKELEQRLTLW